MKKISSLVFVIVTLFMIACTDKQKLNEYTLTGNLANSSDSSLVYLQMIDDNSGEYVSVDTATVQNGTFVFEGSIADSAAARFISTEGLPRPLFVAIEAGNIEVTFDSTMVATIKGTPLNDKYQDFANKRNTVSDEIKAISQQAREADKAGKMTPELNKELEDKYASLYNNMQNEIYDFIKTNISNPLGINLLMERSGSFDVTQLKEVLPLIDAKVKNTARIQRIEQRVATLEATEVGKQFVDIKGTTPDGKEVSLSDYAGKGKYILIDFWASWCPPCRKDMPNVVATYNKFKNKGFDIVGVSLDDDKAAWEKGIKDLKITWVQISDLKGWKTELGAAYAVNSIPHTVLIDKEGKIIAKDLDGKQLDEKLTELLK